jgi:hypothetical protein
MKIDTIVTSIIMQIIFYTSYYEQYVILDRHANHMCIDIELENLKYLLKGLKHDELMLVSLLCA